MNYVETNCIFKHEGKEFEAGGAVVTPNHIIAYLGEDGKLTDWHGNHLGSYKITSTWKTPRSWVSSTYHQVYAIVDGIKYTGRSAGINMSFKGRKVARQ